LNQHASVDGIAIGRHRYGESRSGARGALSDCLAEFEQPSDEELKSWITSDTARLSETDNDR
jgi:hypothetical protein